MNIINYEIGHILFALLAAPATGAPGAPKGLYATAPSDSPRERPFLVYAAAMQMGWGGHSTSAGLGKASGQRELEGCSAGLAEGCKTGKKV